VIPQITVLDAGGQYCHLIARKVRELGVYADVAESETPAAALAERNGVIISGGPSSVYDPASPTIDPALLAAGIPVLGICYGQQLLAHLSGGRVEKGVKGEYGLAHLSLQQRGLLLDGLESNEQVWMSHRDLVTAPPPGFRILASTATCAIAAMEDPDRRLFAVQFHPEVHHTTRGRRILENFVFGVCRCEKDWDPMGQMAAVERQIRAVAGDRNVFFFVSGGVDSTVAYTLCLRALGPDRVHGIYVDTGFMRLGETESVRQMFARLGARRFEVADCRNEFLGKLAGVTDPEQKRKLIGEEFVEVQERILESEHFLDGHWILGQGTIYPDTIESGGTKKADLIKTHHNRVAGIQRLIEENKIVEPLAQFYKDEVRLIGRELGVPQEFLERHPFPGPGLAIRCLCADQEAPVAKTEEGWFVPLRSVGVQGDSRTYRAVLALEAFPAREEEAGEIINRRQDVNRVVVLVGEAAAPLEHLRIRPATLTAERLERLQLADAAVRRISHERGFDRKVWQFPVVLIPLGTPNCPDSAVLRPIHSVDGMTASVVRPPQTLLAELHSALREIPGIAAVFFDLTNKPPATIEWE
jgi:GMP synthase (glutamine-hydrolysing)